MQPAAHLEVPATPAHLAWLTSPGRWAFPPWLRYVNDEVTDFLLAPGQDFLSVEVPVRHGKSTHLSMYTPAWYLGMFPDRQVLLTSYSDSLSRGFGRGAREILEGAGPRLFDVKVRWDARASHDWKLTDGGGMRSVSRGGTITGTGGHLIIIDDPFKDAFEADNRAMRDRVYEWYQRTLRTRLEPGGKIILVMSRWHQDDLGGRLVERPNFDGDKWRRIHLPAIAEPGPDEVLVEGEEWHDIIGRVRGEALWPERYNAKRLLQTRVAVGPQAWNSNYQQRPVTPGGDMFPRAKWQGVNAAPKGLDLVCRIDLAASERASADFSAMALLGRDPKGFTYVLDVRRVRAESNEVQNWVINAADELTGKFGAIHFVIEQEPGSGGLTVAENYVRDVLAKYSAEKKPSTRDKVINAQPLAGQVQAGNVFMLRTMNEYGVLVGSSWWSMFLEEAAEFPKGVHDDMVDVAAHAYNDLVERARKRKRSKAKLSRPKGTIQDPRHR